MAANAWTEWTKIENGLNPYNGLIRPVIFNSRLYIAWIERREVAKDKASQPIEKEIKYSLKLSHIRYDGSWSAPVNFELEDEYIKGSDGNFYLSYNNESNNLFITLYRMQDSYPDLSSDNILNYKNFNSYTIDEEMVFTKIYNPIDKLDEEVKNIYLSIKNEFDTINNEIISHNVNNAFIIKNKVNYTIGSSTNKVTLLASDFVSLDGSQINNAKVLSFDDHNVNVGFSTSVSCYLNPIPESKKEDEIAFNAFMREAKIDDKLSNIYYMKKYMNSWNNIYYPYYIGVNLVSKRVYIFIYNNKEGRLTNDSDFIDSELRKPDKFVSSLGDKYGFDIGGNVSNYSHYLYHNCNDMEVEKIIKPLINGDELLHYIYLLDYSGSGDSRTVLTNQNRYAIDFSILKYKNINDIKIKISSESNQYKEYSLSEWSKDKHVIKEGDNYFNSQSNVLVLPVSINDFINDGKSILTANIQVIGEEKNVLVDISFNFEIKQLMESLLKDSVINLKTNAKRAQYLSMNIADKKMLVRLNTLFARQLVEKANRGIDSILTLDTQRLPEPALEGDTDEIMDFNGANALYFWELFYYSPMMVANVMLEGQNYDEAGRWLRYVFSPNGYIENGVYNSRVWNSQPLLTDTAWDKDQLDSTDPDAVAQTDPMHYKLATFMKCLDILMERGDSAYRVLERDTLNEAKMWYMQALKLLGNETELRGNNIWSAPKLTEAASKTKQPTRAIKEESEETVSPRTANSLTSLFLPQINEKLAQYRDTLKVRLFNLRHNLSIDGQPLSLAIYAMPADPKALQNAAVNQSQGGSTLPNAVMPTQRFPVILNSAKSVVNQLMQFGSSLSSITERQDAQALSELLTTQGSEIILQNIKYQKKAIEEFTHNENALLALLIGAQNRSAHYSKLYDENISTPEQQAMDLYLSSSVLNTVSQGINIAGAFADLVPNIYGLAVGGSRLGAVFNATSIGLQLSGSATRIAADRLSQSESYRRRREEWGVYRDNAEVELEQLKEQLEALKVRKEAANLQLDSLKLQQQQTQEHLTFLQNKFTNKALYNWLRGKLMAIYKPFYDLTVSRCRMTELAYQYDLGETQTFIRPGAWQGTYSGLMAGESLMHNLTQMENSYLEKDKRVLEITKIVSLADVYQGLSSNKFGFEQVADVINKSKTQLGTAENGITLKNGQLQASIKLSDLAIDKDYPADLGKLRRVKQISVTLPALTGTYQNIRAVLNYGGSAVKPRGCNAIAISHGMNDSGQFQLNFNDDRYLPFEGLPVNDTSTLTLSFPDATDKQKEMLLTLNDIILHINYTIR